VPLHPSALAPPRDYAVDETPTAAPPPAVRSSALYAANASATPRSLISSKSRASWMAAGTPAWASRNEPLPPPPNTSPPGPKSAPGNNQGAGTRESGRAGPASRWLRSILIEAAHAAGRTKRSYYSSVYHRIAAPIGKKRAALAVVHAILVTIYHLIARRTSQEDLGPNHYEERRQQTTSTAPSDASKTSATASLSRPHEGHLLSNQRPVSVGTGGRTTSEHPLAVFTHQHPRARLRQLARHAGRARSCCTRLSLPTPLSSPNANVNNSLATGCRRDRSCSNSSAGGWPDTACARAFTRSPNARQAASISANEPYSLRRFVARGSRSALAIRAVASDPPLLSGSA
jgi:hypothetical protein